MGNVEMLWYFVRMFHNYIFNSLETFYRSLVVRRIRHNSNDVAGEQYQCIQILDTPEQTSEEPHSWVDSLPFEIPFGLATTFKSDEDWLDDWEEVNQVIKKPYTFDDRVDDYRRGIRKALKKTEKQEEQEDEVDLMFADVDESESPMDLDRLAVERFTPVCTPSRNRKDLLECEEGEWDSEWDEDGESLKSDNMPMYV